MVQPVVPSETNIRGILFDKDGTLLDFAATWHPVNRQVALQVAQGDRQLAARLLLAGGHDPATDCVAAGSPLSSGNTLEIADIWKNLLNYHIKFEDLTARIDDAFLNGGQEHATPVPGLHATLKSLSSRGLRLGVATNDSEMGARSTLKKLDILNYFDLVAGYDSGYGGKPDPGMVRAFCAATDLAPAQVAVVGDSLHDLEMGRRAEAGLLIGVLTGTGDRDLLEPHATLVLDSIADLKVLL